MQIIMLCFVLHDMDGLTRLACATLSAAQACGVPSGQSVGLWWSPAEGLAHTHVYTAAGPFLTRSR